MDLYIAEKPSLARTLAEYLANGKQIQSKQGYIVGPSWIMTWCIGHLYELFSPADYGDQWGGSWSVASLPIIPETFQYKPVKKTASQLNVVLKLCRKATNIYHMGDPDREGQNVIDLVIQHSDFNGSVFRVWPNDLSPSGLKKVFANIKLNSEYRSLSLSAQCRSYADWLVGLNFTRLYTCMAQEKGFQGTLSLGRVQTVAFSLVHNRCIDIERFKPIVHFGLRAFFRVNDEKYTGDWLIPSQLKNEHGYLIDSHKITSVIASMDSGNAIVKDVSNESKSENAPLPFSLSKLQIYCSKKFGYGAKQVLDGCQYLYEEFKSLTYPRTDCQYLSQGDFKDADSIIRTISRTINLSDLEKQIKLSKPPRCYNDAKTTAHTGIVPTTIRPDFSKIDTHSSKQRDNKRMPRKIVLENIYDTVCKRFVAQFLPAYEYKSSTIITAICGYEFKSNGKSITQGGWKSFLTKANEEVTEKFVTVPCLSTGQSVTYEKSEQLNKKTRPPEFFTEGTLIAALANISSHVEDENIKQKLKESDGVGTEATRADIIEKIKHVGYVSVIDKKLKVTALGRDIYPSFPSFFKTPAMTAIWESALGGIADGKLDHNAFNRNIVSWTETQIECLKKKPPNILVRIDDKYCCSCGATLALKKGKYGEYYSCLKKNCTLTYKVFNRAPLFPLDNDGIECPECKKNGQQGKMVTRVKKINLEKGLPAKAFLGCDQFPSCSHAIW